jgi:hypothetical protein
MQHFQTLVLASNGIVVMQLAQTLEASRSQSPNLKSEQASMTTNVQGFSSVTISRQEDRVTSSGILPRCQDSSMVC